MMFKFGENWASFSRQLDESRIDEPERSLISLFGEGALKGSSFLDIGCGCGLFSIAAARLGAWTITGIDVDPVSVRDPGENANRWLGKGGMPSFRHMSSLYDALVGSLGKSDLVYSWGVLHHSGNMRYALANTSRAVKRDGLLMIAIYNRHWYTGVWKVIKRWYNWAGLAGLRLMIWLLTQVIFLAKWAVTFNNPFERRRGMDHIHNVIDWVGGDPYEYAGVA